MLHQLSIKLQQRHDHQVKDLLVVDGTEIDVIERSFIKLLYKRTSRGISTPDSNQIEVIEVSDTLFDEALEVFDKSSENLSESFKSANGFRVAYIPYKWFFFR